MNKKNGNLKKLTHAKRKLTQPVNHEWLFTCASQCTPSKYVELLFSCLHFIVVESI